MALPVQKRSGEGGGETKPLKDPQAEALLERSLCGMSSAVLYPERRGGDPLTSIRQKPCIGKKGYNIWAGFASSLLWCLF